VPPVRDEGQGARTAAQSKGEAGQERAGSQRRNELLGDEPHILVVHLQVVAVEGR
jgi:hypothetical protein